MQPNEEINQETGEITDQWPWSSSRQLDQLAVALCKAQGQFGKLIAGKTAEVAHRSGGKHSYTYADLADAFEVVRKPLAEAGLAVLQRTSNGELETILLHTSGQWISGRTPLHVGREVGPQQFGSALTYARRYGLLALLGLATEDDDAASAQASRGMGAPPPRQEQQGGGAPAEDPSAIQLADEFVAEFRRLADLPPTIEVLRQLESIPPKIKAANLPQAAYQRAVAAYNPVVIALRAALGINGSQKQENGQ